MTAGSDQMRGNADRRNRPQADRSQVVKPSSLRVHIVGGGIAGLTVALAFALQGASVSVSERAHSLSEVGAGIQITPNGARVFGALGVWDDLVSQSIVARAVVPTDGLTGRTITRFDLTGHNPNYLFVYRPTLIAVLDSAARAAGVQVTLGAKMDAADVMAQADDVDLIVGADGLHSRLRGYLNGATDPFFTGQVAWRGIIAADAVAEARIWMLPGRHVVTYPLSGGRLNIVAVQERAAWAGEGWHHADDPANLRAAFDDGCDALRGHLAPLESANLWGLFRHPVAERWTDGKLALVGDAAHPTLPFLAQGANLAVEDAFVLARMVAERGVADGLPAYAAARRPRVVRAIAAANGNAVNYHLRGLRRGVSHQVLRGIGTVAPGAFMRRLAWLYDYDVTA